jgi:hypothetical protein
MAKVAKNLILHGASGKIGDMLVIRQRGGSVILSQAPGERTTEPTEAQKAHQQKFQQAVLYARMQMADETTKAEYAAKATGLANAYNVAVADFFNAPNIDEIDVSQYQGAVGDTIRIRVTDDFKVKQVHLAIYNADGSLVESGDAVKHGNEIDWIYTATLANEAIAGDRIVIRASDQPGNITEQEQAL